MFVIADMSYADYYLSNAETGTFTFGLVNACLFSSILEAENIQDKFLLYNVSILKVKDID